MLNPWMLLGLLGLSVPVVIHLIHRQKLQPRLLATLKFLEKTDVSNAFAFVPRDVLQLLLRLLLLTLFVLLMSRFMVGSSRVGTRAMVVVLDQSMSMQRKMPGGKSLFEVQKEQIAELIDEMKEDDQMALVLAGDVVAADTGFLRNKQELKATLAEFNISDGGGRAIYGAVRQSVDQLKDILEPNACVLVFSDHQRTNYQPHLDKTALAESVKGSRVKLLLVAPELKEAPNLTIASAEFTPRRIYLGTSSKIAARVQNLTDEEQDVEVSLSEGEKAGETRPLTLAPRETATIDLAHIFESSSDVPCTVSISDDVLPADNVFHAPMRVQDQRQVLVVAQAPSERQRDFRVSAAGVDLLTYAINPGEALGMGTGTHIRTKRVTANLVERLSLPLYSTIVLYGITELPGENSVQDLVAYVKNGGGLYIIPDRGLNPVRFNELFAPLLSGFQLGSAKSPDTPAFIDKNEAAITQPLLLPLVREAWGEIEDISFTTWFNVVNHGSAGCALRADTGDMLAGTIPLGRGHVYVQLFSCNVQHGSMPRSPVFVPMVQEIIDFLSGKEDEKERDVIRVNDMARLKVPELRNVSGEVKLRGPRDYSFMLDPERPGTLQVTGIRKAGNYRLYHEEKKGARARWLAVNPVRGESQLTQLTAEEEAALLEAPGMARVPFEEVRSHFARRREIFGLMAVLLFLAFLAEAAWGARQSARKGESDAE